MSEILARKRYKPGIGPRGLFGLLTVALAIFLIGSLVWPNVPGPAKEAIQVAAISGWCLFVLINVAVALSVQTGADKCERCGQQRLDWH